MNNLKNIVGNEVYMEILEINENANEIFESYDFCLLSFMTDLFEWGQHKYGYEYWYDVAHKEYINV